MALGITQDELGQILGCTQQMIQNYEMAYCAMPILMLKDMALLCKSPVDWFFIDDNSILVYFTYLKYPFIVTTWQQPYNYLIRLVLFYRN